MSVPGEPATAPVKLKLVGPLMDPDIWLAEFDDVILIAIKFVLIPPIVVFPLPLLIVNELPDSVPVTVPNPKAAIPEPPFPPEVA
ncbi:hypothetical protein FV185_12210 [Ferrovum sp. PN-J185]|nr:hypothetical protein FV185_12210 [Ferrovum sp. PN-J185]